MPLVPRGLADLVIPPVVSQAVLVRRPAALAEEQGRAYTHAYDRAHPQATDVGITRPRAAIRAWLAQEHDQGEHYRGADHADREAPRQQARRRQVVPEFLQHHPVIQSPRKQHRAEQEQHNPKPHDVADFHPVILRLCSLSWHKYRLYETGFSAMVFSGAR